MNKLLSCAMITAAVATLPAVLQARHADHFAHRLAAHAAHAHHLPYTGGYNAAAHTGARTTSTTASRLVKDVYLTADSLTPTFHIVDSTVVTYSGSNGSATNPQSYDGYADEGAIWKFSTGISYDYNVGTAVYTNGGTFSQTFDAAGNIATYSDLQWNTATSAYVNAYQNVYTYDGANNMLTETYQNWDATSSSWLSNFRYVYTYTATNKVATEIDQELTSGVWTNGDRFTNTYDGADNLITHIEENWNTTTGVWQYPEKFTYTYTSGVLTSILNQLYDSTAGSWENEGNTTFTDFAGTQPQTITSQYWADTSFVNSERYNYTYNSYGQPTYYYQQYWNTTTNAWDIEQYNYSERLYYETYSAESVATINSANGTVQLYPVPAKNELSIKVSWDQPQPFTISIIDMQGRIINDLNVATCAAYQATIPVSDLAAGNYIVKVQGIGGSIAQQITVAK